MGSKIVRTVMTKRIAEEEQLACKSVKSSLATVVNALTTQKFAMVSWIAILEIFQMRKVATRYAITSITLNFFWYQHVNLW